MRYADTDAVMTRTPPATTTLCAAEHAALGVRATLALSLRAQSLQLVFWLVVFALSFRADAAAAADGDIVQRIQRGESFLTNLFDLRLQLLPEYRGSSTYWLFHDNY